MMYIDKSLKVLKNQAHQAFDSWWQSRGIHRGAAYKKLSKVMKVSPKDCHILKFNK